MCLGEHPAIADHDDMLDPEPLGDLRDRVGQRLLVLRVAVVYRDRDRPALWRARQPVVDLQLALDPVA